MSSQSDVEMNEENLSQTTLNKDPKEPEAKKVTYTPDEDFEELTDRDETTEIIAYVDELHAPQVVGSKAKFDLFKFTLSNGSTKRITCLVWGKPLIKKYENEVTIGRILQIEGGHTKSVSQNYYKEGQNLVPFELLIKDSTTITYHGQHKQVPVHEPTVRKVTFEEIGKISGLVSIEGHIRMKFVKCENKYKGEFYGCGAITDGNVKVTIHVANYNEMNIEKGVLVRAIGEVSTGGPLILQCRDEASVTRVEGGKIMDADVLARGVKTPKRSRE